MSLFTFHNEIDIEFSKWYWIFIYEKWTTIFFVLRKDFKFVCRCTFHLFLTFMLMSHSNCLYIFKKYFHSSFLIPNIVLYIVHTTATLAICFILIRFTCRLFFFFFFVSSFTTSTSLYHKIILFGNFNILTTRQSLFFWWVVKFCLFGLSLFLLIVFIRKRMIDFLMAFILFKDLILSLNSTILFNFIVIASFI